MLEKTIEAHLVKRVKERGGVAYKFTSPQRRSVPDRLVLMDAAKGGELLRKLLIRYRKGAEVVMSAQQLELEAAELTAAMVHFVELKATGAKPTPGQLREHARLEALGFPVLVIDNKEEIDRRYGK